MTTAAVDSLPLVLDEVEVVSTERLSPSYVRLELGGPALAEFGVEGPLLDQRIKLVVPPDSGVLPSFRGAGDDWYAAWRALPEAERGHMRTYSVRQLRGTGAGTRLVVDVVVHDDGAAGPGARWALAARPGDRVVLVGPRRGCPFGGIEFRPGAASRLLLVGDETAVPAVAAILADLPDEVDGTVFLEVPLGADVLDVPGPPGMDVVWLPRDGAPLGERLHAAVVRHLGGTAGSRSAAEDRVGAEVWETPTYSSSGQLLPAGGTDAPGDLYAWIAGESGVVTGLRRHLVREVGLDRRQVAFMGYWRRGVAMRS